MVDYSKLDELIIKAISNKKNPLDCFDCMLLSSKIARENCRERYRVIDGRMTQLKKSGKIQHLTKSKGHGETGWRLVGAKEQ